MFHETRDAQDWRTFLDAAAGVDRASALLHLLHMHTVGQICLDAEIVRTAERAFRNLSWTEEPHMQGD